MRTETTSVQRKPEVFDNLLDKTVLTELAARAELAKTTHSSSAASSFHSRACAALEALAELEALGELTDHPSEKWLAELETLAEQTGYPSEKWRAFHFLVKALFEEKKVDKGEEVAADLIVIIAEKDLCDVVLGDEILSAIDTLTALLPKAGQKRAFEQFKQTAIEAFGDTSAPQQKQAAVQAADEALAVVKGDSTLLRQWHVYQRLLTTVVLPPDKQLFETLEEAKAGKNLEATYRRARERQEKLGIELVPENDKYIKRVASAATLTYLKLKTNSDTLVA